jgi:hypothetical protein
MLAPHLVFLNAPLPTLFLPLLISSNSWIQVAPSFLSNA